MNKIFLILIAFIASSTHISVAMKNNPQKLSQDLSSWIPAPNTKDPASIFIHHYDTHYKEISSAGKVEDGSVHENTLPFYDKKSNHCILTVSKKDYSCGLYHEDSGKKILFEHLSITPQQFESMKSKIDKTYTIIYHDGKRYDIRRIETIEYSLEEQNEKSRLDDIFQKEHLLATTTKLEEVTAQLKEKIKELEALGKNLATFTTDNEKLSAAKKNLSDQFKTYTSLSSERDENCRKVARYNTFLKGALFLALISIVCQHYGLISKTISS